MNPKAELGSRYVIPRTENNATLGPRRMSGSPPVLVGRQASPVLLNGSLRLGLYIALNDEVIRP